MRRLKRRECLSHRGITPRGRIHRRAIGLEPLSPLFGACRVGPNVSDGPHAASDQLADDFAPRIPGRSRNERDLHEE
jgi:hypothetical protein